jgi:spondin-1
MLDPSPDWIVGVSGLELCLPNCTWIENKVLNLYPWDAGTDSGPTYISPDQPTNPREVIKRIKSTSPNDPRSPFYDSNGSEMKPLARLYLSRQRLYEKTCDQSQTNEDDTNDVCATGLGTWSECSVTCGKGKKTLQLQYLNPAAAHAANCNAKLTKRKECVGSMPYCPDGGENEEENTEAPDPECQVSEFGPWSKCDPPCGKGNQTRSRTLIGTKEVRKRCRARPNSPKLIDWRECELECTGDLPEALTMRHVSEFKEFN